MKRITEILRSQHSNSTWRKHSRWTCSTKYRLSRYAILNRIAVARCWRTSSFDISPICRYVDTCGDCSGQPGMQLGELHLQLTAQIYICRIPARDVCSHNKFLRVSLVMQYSCSCYPEQSPAFWQTRVARGSLTNAYTCPSMIYERSIPIDLATDAAAIIPSLCAAFTLSGCIVRVCTHKSSKKLTSDNYNFKENLLGTEIWKCWRFNKN